MKQLLFLFLFVLPITFAFTQSINNNDTFKLYKIGYKNIITKDSGRKYKPQTRPKDQLHFRPLEIDVWYPASNLKSDQSLKYGEFINLLEQRSNRFQNDTIYNNLSAGLVQYICSNLNITDTAKLTRLKTYSYKNADAVNQRFPLIVYMCSFNGMSYENVNLFEWLSSHGYIVACITSVGRYPGNMSTSYADLIEQVHDGIFAINYLKARINIDSTKIGAIGYSWGGLAALNLAMDDNDVKAILSLDGSEIHYYGESKEEDKDFDVERSFLFFHLNKLCMPYAYLESGFKQTERKADSIFNILPFFATHKLYMRFPKAAHEDFSCLPSLVTDVTLRYAQ